MPADWPKWREMHGIILHEGPSDGVKLPIQPTMKEIEYEGERYFRMKDTRYMPEDGSDEPRGCYLWDGWWDQMVAQKNAEKAG